MHVILMPKLEPALVCDELRTKLKIGGKLKTVKKPVPVVDLPLGATEDRVIGALDIEKA
jgi:magnesium chelatase subunit I